MIMITINNNNNNNNMRNKFETVVGQKISDREWTLACLPTKNHGCGLGKPEDTCASAFAANVEETLKNIRKKLPGTDNDMSMIHAPTVEFHAHDFVNRETMLFVTAARDKKQIVTNAASELDELPLLIAHDNKENKKKTQHVYSEFINRSRAKYMSLLIKDLGTPIAQANHLSNDGSFAGAWLHGIPKDSYSTMSNSEFTIAVKLRLGIPFNNLVPKCCCRNQTTICERGRHFFSCNEFKNLLLMRHDAIQHGFKELGAYGGINVIDKGLDITESDGRKGDLLFKGLGRQGRDLVVDISIGDPSAQSYLHNSAYISKYVADLLEANKLRKYAAAYREAGVDFMPLTCEMLGATSDLFIKFLKKLVAFAADVNNIHYSVMFNYWQKRLSITMQRYNAKIIHLAQKKIARVNNSVCNGDFDLTDIIANERHTHGGF